jgi:hypothetical protein
VPKMVEERVREKIAHYQTPSHATHLL